MTTTTIGSAFRIDNDTGEVVANVIGASALLATVADAVGIERDSVTGKLRLMAAGPNLALGVQRDEMSKFAGALIKGPLVANDALGGIFTLTNTYGSNLVASVRIYVAVVSAAACLVDVGVGSLAAPRDNILDGINMAALPAGVTPGVYSSLSDKHTGTNGQGEFVWPNAGLLHASVSGGGASAGLVGTYSIHVLDIL